jgi:hypothetical protein
MKLKEFNSENTITVRGGRSTTPKIGLSTKTGLFNFNRSACQLIDLKPGEQIVILQDEEDTENWFLEKVKQKGFVLREKGNFKGLLFNNTTLARAIADSVSFKEQSGRILIAGKSTVFEKRKLWGLLTASLRNKINPK